MRIVIDLQGAQGASRHRGIGRYSLSLAQAMTRHRGKHEIIIALNGMFPETIEPIRAAFDGLIDQENIRVWQSIGPVNPLDPKNAWRRLTAELLREAFLASLQPDVIHITSIFEGFGDDAVHSIGLGPWPVLTSVTLYDLIPLIQSDVYLKPNPTYKTFYSERLDYLKRANIYLCISESSKQEVIDHLDVKSEQAINIGAAAESFFKPISVTDADESLLRRRFDLTRPFFMYSGATDERKNHLRLIKAFSLLPEALRKRFQLAIVGHLPQEHITKFNAYRELCGLDSAEVIITGRVTDKEMLQFYNLCYLFIFPSWHEGFGLPALEAMSCGAAVIGANTSSLPEVIGRADALFDPFSSKAISLKIAEIVNDNNLRTELKSYGLTQSKKFSWDESAKRTIAAFEHWTAKLEHTLNLTCRLESSQTSNTGIIDKIANIKNYSILESDWLETSRAIAQNHPAEGKKQLLIDVSELVHRDHKTGIQRVVRSVLSELLANPPQGFNVKPIYAIQHEPGYRYAQIFLQQASVRPDDKAVDEPVDFYAGDIFVGLDLQHHVVIQQAASYTHLRSIGVKVYFVVYDLLPVLLPQVFPAGTDAIHAGWLKVLADTDGVVCISRAVADEMVEWLAVFGSMRLRPFKIGWFHLGADLAGSSPSKGLPPDSTHVLRTLASRRTFLSVGTIEPRKGQLQTLTAFEQLWDQGIDINLVLIGKHGWNVDLLVEMLCNHSESNRRLFWLEGVSDEYLEKVYASSDCLIAASEGEGFGLPLIEAAQHRLPIIARDIPVFREVAGRYAYYFSGLTPDALASGVLDWLDLDVKDQAPKSENMEWLTWKQATQSLVDICVGNRWYRQWMPDGIRRFWGSDDRLATQVGLRSGRHIKSTGKAGYLLFGPYITLAAGRYRVSIKGSATQTISAKAFVDVVANQGKHVLGELTLSTPSHVEHTASLFISLDQPCTDLEVRVWVNDGSNVRVSLLEIAPWQSSDVYGIWGGDKRLGTQVGERAGLGMASTGRSGYLLFGPYIPMDAGQYRVTLRGAWSKNGAADAKFDVAIQQGRLILGECAVDNLDGDDSLASLVISLTTACTDFEVRVWVSESTELQISMIEIAPLGENRNLSAIGSQLQVLKQIPQQEKRQTLADAQAQPDAQPEKISLIQPEVLDERMRRAAENPYSGLNSDRNRKKTNRKKKR